MPSNKRRKKSTNLWWRPGPKIPEDRRTIFAACGSPPRFKHLFVTLRIVHLFDLPAEDKAPYHFPDCASSTHWLTVHTRIWKVLDQKWSDFDLTVSIQFDWDLQIKPGSLIQHPNTVAKKIGLSLVNEYIPSISDEWILRRFYEAIFWTHGIVHFSPLEKNYAEKRAYFWAERSDWYFRYYRRS